MYLIGQYPIKNLFSVKDYLLNKKVLRQKQNKLATAPNQLLQNITPLQKKKRNCKFIMASPPLAIIFAILIMQI